MRALEESPLTPPPATGLSSCWLCPVFKQSNHHWASFPQYLAVEVGWGEENRRKTATAQQTLST